MKTQPGGTPIGVLLTNASRDINRAFDAALEAVGGSRSSWLILMALKRGPLRNQRELAAMVGVEGATLSHHLNGMEAAGLGDPPPRSRQSPDAPGRTHPCR